MERSARWGAVKKLWELDRLDCGRDIVELKMESYGLKIGILSSSSGWSMLGKESTSSLKPVCEGKIIKEPKEVKEWVVNFSGELYSSDCFSKPAMVGVSSPISLKENVKKKKSIKP